MQSKSDAIRTETQLLNTFDYAWNTSINGSRRPDDILEKLKKISSSTSHFSDIAHKLLRFSQKQVGIKIKARQLPSAEHKTCADEESHNFLSRVFKIGRSHRRLVFDRRTIVEEKTTICGVVLGHDSICRRPPVEGRKRCSEHKGMKIKGSIKVEILNKTVHPQSECAAPSSSHDLERLSPVTVNYVISERFTPICGFILPDGSPCRSQPIQGNKRCLEHKGRRIHKPNSISVQKEKLDYLQVLVSESEIPETCNPEKIQAQLFPKRPQ